MTKKEPRIKIFVSHHKPWYIYEDDIYIPIQVGKKNAKVDLWILWDDTWDNISDKNSNYAELTAQYWVWKNYDLSDVDYVGFCHYRRYMTYCYKPNFFKYLFAKNPFSSIEWKNNLLWKLPAFKEGNCIFNFDKKVLQHNKLDLQKYISSREIDLYTVKREVILSWHIKSFFWIKCKQCTDFWFLWSHKKLKNEAINLLLEIYPNYKNIIEEVNETYKKYYPLHRHIYIMKKDLYLEYMDWLFNYLFSFEKYIKDNNIDTSKINKWDTRFMGIFSETLINYRVKFKEKNDNIKTLWKWNLILFN